MTTILVSGASGVVGYGILRTLRAGMPGAYLVGSSIHATSPASHFSDAVELAPRTDAPGYLDWLTALVRRRQIDVVIPGIEIDVQHWNVHRPAIAAAGAAAVLNDAALIRLCADKWAFAERLREAGAACAIDTSLSGDFDALAARFGLPFIVKPRSGYGSRGVRRIARRADFEMLRPAVGSTLIAQPLVGHDDEEYTVAAFGDGRGGHGTVMAMRRRLAAEGHTDSAEVVDARPFEAAVGELCTLLRPLGPTNFQFRLDGRAPRLLEINPRLSSSASIRAAFGYDECTMAVDFHLHGRWPAPVRIGRGRAQRYVEDLIIHDDRLHR